MRTGSTERPPASGLARRRTLVGVRHTMRLSRVQNANKVLTQARSVSTLTITLIDVLVVGLCREETTVNGVRGCVQSHGSDPLDIQCGFISRLVRSQVVVCIDHSKIV